MYSVHLLFGTCKAGLHHFIATPQPCGVVSYAANGNNAGGLLYCQSATVTTRRWSLPWHPGIPAIGALL
ncbi:MAG: hypothetical protein WDA26_00490 [Pusillimonas sp.]